MMNFQFINDENICTISFDGKITRNNMNVLNEQIRESIEEKGVNHVLFDLSNVYFIDSSGLSIIILAYKMLNEINGCLTLLSPQPCIRKILQITRLDQKVSIRDQ